MRAAGTEALMQQAQVLGLSTRVPLQLESLPKWAIELHAKYKGSMRNVEMQTCLNTKSKDETNTKLGMVIHYNLNRCQSEEGTHI